MVLRVWERPWETPLEIVDKAGGQSFDLEAFPRSAESVAASGATKYASRDAAQPVEGFRTVGFEPVASTRSPCDTQRFVRLDPIADFGRLPRTDVEGPNDRQRCRAVSDGLFSSSKTNHSAGVETGRFRIRLPDGATGRSRVAGVGG
jgi:hypothetical protein